jgi:dienelactone hydrolase
MNKYFLPNILCVLILITNMEVSAQPTLGDIIQNDSLFPKNIPPLLISSNGKVIQTKKDWEKIRRPELEQLLENEIYGIVPSVHVKMTALVVEQDDNAIGGKAIRKQVKITFTRKDHKSVSVALLMYIPKGLKKFPTFLGYNFNGNETIYPDPMILPSQEWNGNNKQSGKDSLNWPVASIINAGCGVATMYYWELAPDKEDFSLGIYPLFYQPNQVKPLANEWGGLAAWAWGLSKALDYLVTDKQVDAKRIIVLGHSRLGKAAIWAGAKDQRFAGVISSGSGAMGVSISKNKKGETLSAVIKRFPRWTSGNFKKYLNQDSNLPFDQHMVVALVAPRPMYISSASEDQWADPSHEYLSAYLSTEVYALYGYPKWQYQIPQIQQPIKGRISQHIRNGKHDILPYDWNLFLEFAKRELK